MSTVGLGWASLGLQAISTIGAASGQARANRATIKGNNKAIKLLNDLDISLILKMNYFVEFYKIILKARIINEDLSGVYKVFNSRSFNKLKISNLINDINNLRHDLYDVTSINETHVLNYFFSELKLSIKQ